MNRAVWIMRFIAPLVVLAMLAPYPVQAQFSKGYKFLEAVRKRNGNDVAEALNDPAGTVVNTKDITSGETAMHVVTARRDLGWMQFFIQKGANVNARDVRGVTPMEIAARLGFHEGAQLLVDSKARVDEPNTAGETPLISAVHQRDVAMMRILLKAGANPERSDNSGRSARAYAALGAKGNSLIAEIEASTKAGTKPGAKSAYGPKF